MLPASFMAEVERQRRQQIQALEFRLAALRSAPLEPVGYGDAIEFEPGDLSWDRAARIAASALTSCDPAHLSSVVLRPYPDKYPGAWRVEVHYKLSHPGPFCGGETYVNAEWLFSHWGD